MQTPAFVALLAADGTELVREFLDKRDSTHAFSSGKVGYAASFKAAVRSTDGDVRRHQCSVNIVEIVPKPR